MQDFATALEKRWRRPSQRPEGNNPGRTRGRVMNIYAKTAEAALRTYAAALNFRVGLEDIHPGDRRSLLQDLITDLHHLLDRDMAEHGDVAWGPNTWEEVLRWADHNYQTEREGML